MSLEPSLVAPHVTSGTTYPPSQSAVSPSEVSSVAQTASKTAEQRDKVFQEQPKGRPTTFEEASQKNIDLMWQATQKWSDFSNHEIDENYRRTVAEIDKIQSEIFVRLAKLDEVINKHIAKILSQDAEKVSTDEIKSLALVLKEINETAAQRVHDFSLLREKAFDIYTKHSTNVLKTSFEKRAQSLEILSMLMREAQKANLSSLNS